MVISAMTYEQVALEDPDGFWELDCIARRCTAKAWSNR
jgi:SHS2 domain-containing protein